MTDSITFFRDINRPISVRKSNTQNGASFDGASFSLSSGEYVVFDMGAESVGGYPVFKVKSFSGTPIVNISYSDRMIPFEKEESMPLGDFTRGSCTYLGVELPVMPANPYRYERYTVSRTGTYIYPLIQGQERFVCFAVSGGEVDFSDFYIIDDSDKETPVGYFESDNEKLDRVWMASAKTVRLATIRARDWDYRENLLLIRKLTKGKKCRVLKDKNLTDIMASCRFFISDNPEHLSGIGFSVFSDGEEGCFISLQSDGEIALYSVFGGKRKILAKSNIGKITDNAFITAEITAYGKGVTLNLDGKTVIDYKGEIKAGGSFGFFAEDEWRAVLTDLSVKNCGEEIFGGDYLKEFGVSDTGYFISDGAKRDRLPWTGDLDWAFDGGWYAFGNKMKAINTLRIMRFNSNPDGFVFGTCYPENTEKPKSGEYGYYQSDMFSVWYAVSALSYAFLSGEEIEEFYPCLTACMDYIWKFVGDDGLFYQRYETSKGLWDHNLGDVGKNTYTNLLIIEGYARLSEYAEKYGKKADAEKYAERAGVMKKAVFEKLYDEKLGGFIKRDDLRELCDMANPFAMGKGMVCKEWATQIAEKYRDVTRPYGKVAILMMKGLYDYGFKEKAEDLLFGKLPLYMEGGWLFGNVDWMSIVDNPDYPETVYECMHNIPANFGDNGNWGDLSHPDSAVNGVISSRIAGVIPTKAGFEEILFRPCFDSVGKVKCGVPTKYGMVKVDAQKTADDYAIKLTVPREVKVKTDFSLLNGEVEFEIETV